MSCKCTSLHIPTVRCIVHSPQTLPQLYAASDICFVHDGRAQLAEVALCMQGALWGAPGRCADSLSAGTALGKSEQEIWSHAARQPAHPLVCEQAVIQLAADNLRPLFWARTSVATQPQLLATLPIQPGYNLMLVNFGQTAVYHPLMYVSPVVLMRQVDEKVSKYLSQPCPHVGQQ